MKRRPQEQVTASCIREGQRSTALSETQTVNNAADVEISKGKNALHFNTETVVYLSLYMYSYTYFLKTLQRFPTEDHLMIHRHKHEMTLKFPSIKNDNMLSGELQTHPCRHTLPQPGSRGTCSSFAGVCRGDSWADTLVCHQKHFMACLYQLFTVM